MSTIKALPNRLKKSPRIAIAFVAIVASVLLLASILTYASSASAAREDSIHVTGAFTGSIEYYLKAPFAVPGTGETINTHADFFTYTGGQRGISTILLQPEVSAKGIIHASFIGPFAGTVRDSAPGSFTQIGTFFVNASGPVWKLHAAFSVGEGLDGLAGICGGGTVSGISIGPIPTNGLVNFSLTYEATYMFGAQCHSPV